MLATAYILLWITGNPAYMGTYADLEACRTAGISISNAQGSSISLFRCVSATSGALQSITVSGKISH